MDKTQEEKFEKAYEATKKQWSEGNETFARLMFICGLNACLEANGIGEDPSIPEGYFKIGEEVEVKDRNGKYVKATICTLTTNADLGDEALVVRRIPAWKPKDGEAVLFYTRDPGCTLVGVYARGVIHAKDTAWPLEYCHYRPFDVDGHGKPWSEI